MPSRTESGKAVNTYKRPSKKKSASQGHPSRGGVTVGGGTKSPPTRYHTPPAGGNPLTGATQRALDVGGKVPGKTGKAVKKGRKQGQRKKVERQNRRLMREIAGLTSDASRHRLHPETGAPRTPIATISPNASSGEAIKKALDIDTKKKQRILKRGMAAERKRTGGIAPGLKHLSYFNRPSQAVGGIIEGKRVDRAVGDAILHGKGKTPSEALGINFGPAAALVDIATDPTTYATFGLAAPEVKAARELGKAAAKHEAKKLAGQSAETNAEHALKAEVAGRAAEKAHLAAHPPTGRRGVTVGMFGKKTSGKLSSKVARKIPKREHEALRDVGSTFSPHVRPANTTEHEFRTLKGAERETRAHVTRGRFRAVHAGRRLKDEIPREHRAHVIDAIETDMVHKLPTKLQGPAREIEKHLTDAIKEEKAAGIQVDERANYFSHHLDELMDAKGKGHGTRGMTFKPGFSKGRIHEGTVREIAERGGPKFSENIPLVVARRLSHSAEAVAQARLNRSVLEAGERVEPGKTFTVGKGQAVAKVKGQNLTFLDNHEAHALANGVADPEAEYAIVNQGFIQGLRDRVIPGTLGDAGKQRILKKFDRLQGTFKLLATYVNPGFHVRNLVGDSWNAYLGQGVRLPVNQARAARVLHRQGQVEESLLSAKAVKDTGKVTVRTRYGEKYDIGLKDLAHEAEEVGAIRQGFLGREIPELLREESSVRRLGRRRSTAPSMRVGRAGKRVIQNREDLTRLASYIHARRQGLNPREAADFTMYHHFDYGDLSGLERGFMRRMFPFYTFTARNIPLQAKALVRRPGRFAAFEHIRRDTAEWLGLSEEEFDNRLKDYQQRAQPFPAKLGGMNFALSAALPVNDIGMLPTSLDWQDLKKVPNEWQVKVLSMLSPIIKDPIEFKTNWSFFFSNEIQDKDHPLVAAPGWAQHLPGVLKKAAGLRKATDGKWMWYAKADYVTKVAPGPFQFFNNVTAPGNNRRGQGTKEKIASYVGGVKVDPIDTQSASIQQLFKRRTKLQSHISALGQLGYGSQTYGRSESKEYLRTKAELARVEERIETLSHQPGFRGNPVDFGRPSKKGFFDSKSQSKDTKFFDGARSKGSSKGFFDDVR